MYHSYVHRHCLLLEDRTEDALLIKKRLDAHGDFGVHWVMDTDEAVKYVERAGEFKSVAAPDLILLDLKLPGTMDGLAFLDWLRKEQQPDAVTPVIVLTAS